jgi:hypothetical protein
VIVAEEMCQKWNQTVIEASCNICEDQCELSIANPNNDIAKNLIVDMDQVISNRFELNIIDTSDMDHVKEDIEENFREIAVMIINDLGLTHMMV